MAPSFKAGGGTKRCLHPAAILHPPPQWKFNYGRLFAHAWAHRCDGELGKMTFQCPLFSRTKGHSPCKWDVWLMQKIAASSPRRRRVYEADQIHGRWLMSSCQACLLDHVCVLCDSLICQGRFEKGQNDLSTCKKNNLWKYSLSSCRQARTCLCELPVLNKTKSHFSSSWGGHE